MLPVLGPSVVPGGAESARCGAAGLQVEQEPLRAAVLLLLLLPERWPLTGEIPINAARS